MITINLNFSAKSRKVKCVPSGKKQKEKDEVEHNANQEKMNKEI